MTTQYFSYLIVGKKNQGKSSWIAERCKALLAKNPNAKILILVNNDPPSYNWIERSSDFNRLEQFCNGKGILKFYPGEGTRKPEEETLTFLATRFRDGLLIVEDATAWIPANPPFVIRNWIINHKNYRTNLFITVHSLIDAPAFCRRHTHRIVLFKTFDDLNTFEADYFKKYPSYFQQLKKAWANVNSAPERQGYIQANSIIDTGV